MKEIDIFLDRQQNEQRVVFLSPNELRTRLEQKSVLYMPVGSIEWHNEHLPLGTDTFHAEILARELCERVGGVILPCYWWNTGACHRHESTYYMPEESYRETLTAVIRGFAEFDAKLLVLVNGHGGNYQRESMAVIADTINQSGDFRTCVMPADPYHMGQSSNTVIDHADVGETSFSMRLMPHLVRMERDIVSDLYSEKLPFANGLPSAKKGNELYEAFMAEAVSEIERCYESLS